MKKYIKFLPVYLFAFCLIAVSCSPEEFNQAETSENVDFKKSVNSENPYAVLGELHAIFIGELYADGVEKYNSRMDLLLSHIENDGKSEYTLEESASLYSTFMEVNDEVAIIYHQYLYSYGNNLKDENLNIFENSFNNFIDTQEPQTNVVVTKGWTRIFRYGGIFSAIATVSGAGCGTRVAAGILDTVIAGAGAVSTGGALAPAVAGSYIGLMATVIDCTT